MYFNTVSKNIVRFLEMLFHRSYFSRNRQIEPSKYMYRNNKASHLSEKFNHPGVKVLEAGSKFVIGTNYKNHFDKANYIGIDVHAGDNVEIVGDVHKLTSFF